MSMNYEHIAASLEDGILTLTLNRPEKLNAYTALMGRELEAAFLAADEDDSVRVVIVTGAGRGFCAGADISAGARAFDSSGDASAVMFGKAGQPRSGGGAGFVGAIYNCRKPSIAAINGPAVGVGLTLTLPMDIRIAADTARFGFVFARRGLVPEAGSAWFLPRIVGLSQAMRWCLSGKLFDAQEALAAGLVSELAEPQSLTDKARTIAREIVDETSPVSVALTRQMLWRFTGDPDPFELLKVDGPLALELGRGKDVAEGVAAFLEKRKPQFPGRVSRDMPKLYPWWER
jgi:enoyl-CoA hydratase/carnithine racemase